MAEVKANIGDIDGLITAIKNSKEAINTKVSIDEPSKSKDIMLFEYIDKVKEISKLLVEYKKLLDKDISDINNSKIKIQEMDKEMVNLSKST